MYGCGITEKQILIDLDIEITIMWILILNLKEII